MLPWKSIYWKWLVNEFELFSLCHSDLFTILHFNVWMCISKYLEYCYYAPHIYTNSYIFCKYTWKSWTIDTWRLGDCIVPSLELLQPYVGDCQHLFWHSFTWKLSKYTLLMSLSYQLIEWNCPCMCLYLNPFHFPRMNCLTF